MLSPHRRLDDGLLHGLPCVVVPRLPAEVVKAKPAAKLLVGVVPLPAPLTLLVCAGGVAQPAHQPSRLRKLKSNPGRHDRVAPGYRQPCQRIGQRPAESGRIRHDFPRVRLASVPIQPCPNRLIRLGFGRL